MVLYRPAATRGHMRLAPGWYMVRRSTTDERYGNSAIIVPETVRDRVATNQWDVVQVPLDGPWCDDEDCDERHTPDHRHPLPEVNVGDWLVVQPRSTLPIPGSDHYVVFVEALVGRLG